MGERVFPSLTEILQKCVTQLKEQQSAFLDRFEKFINDPVMDQQQLTDGKCIIQHNSE